MRIIRAEHLGMCFGVRDAIELAVETAQKRPITVLGDLVHNETVVGDLRAKGIQFVRRAAEASTTAVMITAHGASNKTMDQARAQGLDVMQATCPLVHLAHRAVAELVRDGFHPVLIGKRDHVEVRGITEDLKDFDVILTEADVFELKERPRFGVAAQTTQPIERVRRLVEVIRCRFPQSEVRFVDTVCQPTKQRQNAAIELAQQADLVIVIGGAHSNNTHELVRTCSQYCNRVHHVQTADDLQPAWIADAQTVGITAGTSTPDTLIDSVEQWLLRHAPDRPVSHATEAVDSVQQLKAA
ncbi:MAG TPA: 4-hydroxy-3-methylbut-2-enyl diphosphate reductase [Patescibacteria group bacterium]|nr:4-hydroxy-3-methylbut-2-enyl diphosphate reductase [Patescibacteria group bacterium]